MEINAIDQLARSEQTGTSTARRASGSSDKQFSNLLEAHSARARVDRNAPRPYETARRNDAPGTKPAYVERAEAADRSDRAEASERAERREKYERSDRTERTSSARRDYRAQKAESATGEKPAADQSEDSGKSTKVDKAEASAPADAAAAALAVKAAEEAKLAEDAQAADEAGTSDDVMLVAAKADDEAAAAAISPTADPLAALVHVKLDTPDPLAVPLAPVADIQADADAEASAEMKSAPIAAAPASDGADEASKAAADAKAAKLAAAAQIALPTSTLAETAKQAEPTTEDYADFMLRNPLTSNVLPAADAGKEAVKADSDAKEGKLIVTISQPAAIAAPVAPVTAFAVQAVVSNDNASLDTNLAARMPVEAEDVKAPTKSAEPTNLFAQNLDSARAAQATEEPKPAARAPIVPPHEQVAVHIRKAVADGLDQISIRLNPLELGRIDIKLDVGADGTLRAAFAADRQQTLELLKSDSRQLENALSEAGLRADAGGLNFSLRGDNRENAQAFRDMGAQFADRRNANDAETAAPVAPAGYVRPRAANGRLDLNA